MRPAGAHPPRASRGGGRFHAYVQLQKLRTLIDKRAGKPEDVAGPILFLASDDSLYATGTVLVVDGGFTATY